MLINAHFEGLVERLITAMQKQGMAASKAEAIRIIALDYSNRYPNILSGEDKQAEETGRALKKEMEAMGMWEAERTGARLDALNKDLVRRGVLKENEFVGMKKFVGKKKVKA